MRGEGPSDVLKVWLYAAASVMLGSWATPWVYNAGKALAEVSGYKRTNGGLEWLANLCARADLRQFFIASMLFAAVVLFLPFMESLRGGRGGSGERQPWGIRLPEPARGPEAGQRLRRNPRALQHIARGFIVVTALFLLVGGAMVAAGVQGIRLPDEGVRRFVIRCVGAAIGWAVLQEVVFRGVAMGIFLRAMKPAAALGMSAALFTLVHALRPPAGLSVADPDAAGVGFEMLERTLARFSNPAEMLSTVLPLMVLGGVLAFARWRTASLWLPIGLHAGWIFVNTLLGGILIPTHPPGTSWWMEEASLRQGLLPIAGILVSIWLIEYLNADDPDATDPA